MIKDKKKIDQCFFFDTVTSDAILKIANNLDTAKLS